MRKYTTKRAIGYANGKQRVSDKASREVTVDDVIGALLDLFAHLQIDASYLASRVKSLDHTLLAAHRIYPHSAEIGELLTAWHQNPEYLDDLGNPLPIKMRGPRRSFGNLAKKSVPNIHVSTLLTELERVGAVSIDKNQFIHVHMRSLPVYEDKRLATQYTLTSLDSFIRTLRHNLDSDPSNSDQLFHRVAWNREFDSRLIPTLKIKVKRQGQSFLESFDNWMMRKARAKPRDSKHRGKSTQISIGIYLAVAGE
jgi:hypothetical protein